MIFCERSIDDGSLTYLPLLIMLCKSIWTDRNAVPMYVVDIEDSGTFRAEDHA